MKPEYDINPFDIEQRLVAYCMALSASGRLTVEDSKKLGAAQEALQRHCREYMQAVERRVRNNV